MATDQELFDISDFGSFYASANIVELLADLVAPQAGENSLAIGFDPNVLSTLNSATIQWHGVKNQPSPEILEKIEGSYDAIICAPIFGRTFEANLGGHGEPHEEFWLRWSVLHLSAKGRLAIFVPTGMLSNYSQKSIRAFLIEETGLQAILELPSGWAQGTATQAGILLITQNNERERNVNMFRFDEAETIVWSSLAPYVLSPNPVLPNDFPGKGYAVSFSSLSDLRLDPHYYDPIYINSLIPELSDFTAVKLSEIAEIRSGEKFPKEEDASDLHGVPFVQVAHVTRQGTLDLHNARSMKTSYATQRRGYCVPGDLLITIAGTVGKVALINESPVGVCIDTSLRRLRIKDSDQVLSEYLALFLRSQFAQRQIERALSGTVINVLSNPNLAEITIYIPSISKQKKIIDVFQQLLHSQTEHLLANFPDVEHMVECLKPLTTIESSDPRQTSLLEPPQPNSPSWQEIARNQLPFPIAHAFTSFEGMSTDTYAAQLKALIDTSEAVVYYLYGISVSDQRRRLKLDDADLKVVTDFSIDRRLSFIFRLIKLAKQNTDIQLFVPELIDIDLGVCRDIHNNIRNAQAHLSMLPEPRCKQLVESYQPKLERLLQSTLPLREYKLAMVTKIETRNGRPQYTILSMMSNNPQFRSQVEDLEEHLAADTQQVVLIDQNYNTLAVHPFYVLHAWEATAMHPHLCVFKQLSGDPPRQRLKVESTQRYGETYTETDLGLNELLSE